MMWDGCGWTRDRVGSCNMLRFASGSSSVGVE